jgi:2,4-dienoyl-CoA reductase-like NADH-dependent reductase (Old Yellow Enzyme family)
MLLTPLVFPNLTVKNRIFRSSIAGRFDQYDGSGTQTRINWEEKFARGGVGAIISSFVPVTPRGRILPNFATIHDDNRIPFWRELGKKIHEHDCRFILQLSHGGRQRDIGGFEWEKGLSCTDRPDPLNGFECERMTVAQIKETVEQFAQGARRAREAGLDGVELHGSNGYLITQFLSSAINDRKDEYGGSLRNRARFVLEIVAAIRREAGSDFHLQVKISTTENNRSLQPNEPRGNTIQDSVEVARWLEEAGVHAIHVSGGSFFPHPRNPVGDLPVDVFLQTGDAMISSGTRTLYNYLLFRGKLTGKLVRDRWRKAAGNVFEGVNLDDAHAVKQAVGIPVLVTGGFQTASFIRAALEQGRCDGVTIARPLVANNDLVKQFENGIDRPARPCTYCNRCLVNAVENPMGCYDESRFPSREAMIREILTVFEPQAFG